MVLMKISMILVEFWSITGSKLAKTGSEKIIFFIPAPVGIWRYRGYFPPIICIGLDQFHRRVLKINTEKVLPK